MNVDNCLILNFHIDISIFLKLLIDTSISIEIEHYLNTTRLRINIKFVSNLMVFLEQYSCQTEQDILDFLEIGKLNDEIFGQRCFRPIIHLERFVNELIKKGLGDKSTEKDHVLYLENLSSTSSIRKILEDLLFFKETAFDETNVFHIGLIKFGVCVLTETGFLQFSCPLVRVFYLKKFYERYFTQNDNHAGGDISNFQKFLIDSLCRFHANALRNSLSTKKDGSLNEPIYQHEMYRCMYSIYNKPISVQVGSCFGIRGGIDIFVNAEYQYGIELIKDGSDIHGYHRRFINGNYSTIRFKRYALIDFYERNDLMGE